MKIGGQGGGGRLGIFPIALEVGGRADRDLTALAGAEVTVALTQDRDMD